MPVLTVNVPDELLPEWHEALRVGWAAIDHLADDHALSSREDYLLARLYLVLETAYTERSLSSEFKIDASKLDAATAEDEAAERGPLRGSPWRRALLRNLEDIAELRSRGDFAVEAACR